MGEAKRRQEALGNDYGKESKIVSWFPLTKSQLEKIYNLVMKGSWVGVFIVLVSWLVVRFVGPSFGWWELVPKEGL